MIEFLKNSKTFVGITFQGCYEIDLDSFNKLFSHYVETGENLLDDYSAVIHATWMDDNQQINRYEYDSLLSSISKIRALSILPTEKIHIVIYNAQNAYKNEIDYEAYLRNEPRRKACQYTSKKEVKRKVFKRHGKQCLNCGSKIVTGKHCLPCL